MSGSNPFRRSKIITDNKSFPSIPNDNNDAITSNAAHPTSSVFDVIAPPKPQSSSQSKVVRIATSPLPSPPSDSTSSYFPAVGATRPGGSPPLGNEGNSAPSELTESDPFDSHSSDDDVATERDSRHHEHHHRQSIAEPLESRNPADALPAVASRSPPSGRTSYNRFTMGETKPSGGNVNNDNNNNTLDVEAFTRLLMTGSAEVATKTTPANPSAALSPDTASDPITRIPSENSTNNNNMRSKSSQLAGVDGVAGIKRVSTLPAKTEQTEIQRAPSVRRPKPPPPRSHHGKPINPGDSVPPSRKTSEPVTSHATAPHIQMLADFPTDHREMLSSLSSGTGTSSPTLSETGSIDDSSSLHRTSSQSKRPPTPPLARRRSQMKPHTKQSALDRSHRLSLTHEPLGSQIPGPLSPGMGARTPRPPSRRHEKAVAGAHPDFTSSQSKSSLSQGESASTVNHLTDEQGSTVSSSPPSRRSSVQHNPTGTATATTTTTGSGIHMPPPPPPPRRLRASSKSSSTGAQVPVAAATLPAEKADVNDNETNLPPSASNAEDILADLSRLQQEVDNLRVHYADRKVSQ